MVSETECYQFDRFKDKYIFKKLKQDTCNLFGVCFSFYSINSSLPFLSFLFLHLLLPIYSYTVHHDTICYINHMGLMGSESYQFQSIMMRFDTIVSILAKQVWTCRLNWITCLLSDIVRSSPHYVDIIKARSQKV